MDMELCVYMYVSCLLVKEKGQLQHHLEQFDQAIQYNTQNPKRDKGITGHRSKLFNIKRQYIKIIIIIIIIINIYHYVLSEVVNSPWIAGLLQMIVEPPQEYLLRRESHQVTEVLAIFQQSGKTGTILQGYLSKQANLERERERERRINDGYNVY